MTSTSLISDFKMVEARKWLGLVHLEESHGHKGCRGPLDIPWSNPCTRQGQLSSALSWFLNVSAFRLLPPVVRFQAV